MGPLRGEYGFLTKFGGDITVDEARNRVRLMQSNFGIMEFQFYNAFAGYSHPPRSGDTSWYTNLFHQPVSREILQAYIEEIKFWDGRAWLTVQAMGTDPGDGEEQRDFEVHGQYMVEDQPLVDVIAPTAEWAEYWAPRWIEFAVDLGFSGIHWNTLGNFEGRLGEHSDIPGFLQTTLPKMQAADLGQTFNFVDGFQWDQGLVDEKVIAFTFWPAWTRPTQEQQFIRNVPPGSVFLCFPGKDEIHEGEWWQEDSVGKHPLDLVIERWGQARCHGDTFLAIGDGAKYVTTDYYPDAQELTEEEIRLVVDKVFDNPPCAVEEDGDVQVYAK